MRQVIVRSLHSYKRYLSPLLPRSCRFSPTCSEFCALAVMKHGVGKGFVLGLWRLLRCHPLHPGGLDIP